jgi:aspartate/methionine/tyrosine aminotransferase
MAAVQEPVIPAVAALIEAHPGTLSLAQGVVYYGPPPEALAAARRFGVRAAEHRYGPVDGLPQLIEHYADKLERENRVRLADRPWRIVTTAGANMGFLNALFAITDPGDEVILPLPYYFNHEMAVRMLSCTPVFAPTDENFQLDLERLRGLVGPRTRAIVTVSPNNPSGAVYPPDVLRVVNALCGEHGIYHISDEAYEHFAFGDAEVLSPASLPDAHPHTVTLHSLSKAYGFAGWRIGFMLLPEHLYRPVIKAQDTNLICPAIPSQLAAIALLEHGEEYRREHLARIAGVRRSVLEALERIGPAVRVPRAEGAFYVLIRVETDLGDMEIVERLIVEHGVAVIPGAAFGLVHGCYLRVSYGGLEPDAAVAGIGRLAEGLRALTAR